MDPEFTIENNILKGVKKSVESYPSMGEYLSAYMDKNCDFQGIVDVKAKKTYTLSKMKDLSIRCALWLTQQGIRQNDVVALCSHNHLNSSIPFFATIFIGAIINPWYHKLPSNRAEHFLNLIQPKIIFCTKECVKTMAEAAKNTEIQIRIVTFEKVPGFECFENVINSQNVQDVRNFRCPKIPSLEKTMAVLFSSGTTGMPKGVELPHKAFIHTAVSTTIEGFGKSLTYSTLSWISGVIITITSVLTPMTFFIDEKFDVHETCKLIEKNEISWVLFSTSIFHQLYKAGTLPQYNLKSLKVILTGGSKTSVKALDYFAEVLPGADILHVYGEVEEKLYGYFI